jgi:hypothetical protein
MTNKGLSMEFSLVTASSQENSIFDADDTYLAPLQIREGNNSSMFAILLRCLRGNQYRRVSSGELIQLSGWNHWMLGQIAPRRRVVQVKQEDDFELSFMGFYEYKFSVPSNVLSLKGFEVTDRYTTTSNWSTPGSSRGVGAKFGLEEGDSAEERILIDNVGEEGVTAALEFTKRIEDASASRETFAENADPTAAEFAEAEAQLATAPVYAEAERFIAIFNIYATRARLGILIPRKDEKTKAIVEKLLKYHQTGDWMTASQYLFPEPKLTSGSRISAQLIRDQNELGLRSYTAEITFEEARAELANTEVLPHQILPPLPELDNTEVAFIKRRESIFTDPITHHISSFLTHRELEKEKRELPAQEPEGDESEDDQDSEHPRVAEEESQPPSQSTQLEVQQIRQTSVSPVLPDLHRMSGFGVDLFSLPQFSEHEEPVPRLPLSYTAESAFPLSNTTFFASTTESPEPLAPLSPKSTANHGFDARGDGTKDDDEVDASQEDDEDEKSDEQEHSGSGEIEDGNNHEDAKTEHSGSEIRYSESHRKEEPRIKGKRARNFDRK